MSGTTQSNLPRPSWATEAEWAKDLELARRIDEIAELWKDFTPPARHEEGAGA